MGMLSLRSILLLQLFLLHFLSCCSAFPSCRYDQSSALLDFKNSFSIKKPDPSSYTTYYCDYFEINSYPVTSTWKNGTNCCLWDGVTCNTLGHVIGLELTCSWLHGKIHPNSSLFQLTHLQLLALELNDFQGSQISSQFAQLVSLTHLTLYHSYFSGEVPFQISHLHKLISLDLRWNFEYDSLSLKPNTWKRLIKNLTNIRELYFSGIDMSLIPASHLLKNLSSSLAILWLDYTRLQGNLEDNIHYFSQLQEIGLKGNINLLGYLPNSNGSNSLQVLDLSGTSFIGELPHSIGLMKSLYILDLSSCQFVGKIPASFWNLTQLTYLDLFGNNFSGQISSSLSNLQHLTFTDLSSNNFSGEFPRSIFYLENLTFLNLSHNFLQGTIQRLSWKNLHYLDLSFNLLQGELTSTICNASTLEILNLSHNNFTGTIPQCIGSSSLNLGVLDLQMNSFSGTIPETFKVGNKLRTLNFNDNLLEGSLPLSLVNCTKLNVLDLGKNSIEDAFPYWLQTLEELQVLVLRENKLHGIITNFEDKTKHPFPRLRIFDVSSNNLSGTLPIAYFKSFKAMMDVDGGETGLQYMSYENFSTSHPGTDLGYYFWLQPRTHYQNSIEITLKGLDIHLEKILTAFTTIDLSNNMFEGEIPQVIGELNSLKGLNLSHNRLTGAIPKSMGNLRNWESLDLSSNKLTGQIPMELTNLNFLGVLNLSKNQLEGCIPLGKQFDTFTSDSFKGNMGLRGFQVSIVCSTNERRMPLMYFEYGFKFEFGWKPFVLGYICGATFGAIMGWVVILIGKPRWLVNMVEDPPRKVRYCHR